MTSCLIVGNVDCEAQCGAPELRNMIERWESTVVAHRLIWLCVTAQDLCVFPSLMRDDMILYVGSILQLPLSILNQIAPNLDTAAPILLTEAVMNGIDVTQRVRELGIVPELSQVTPYFVDPGLAKFCRNNRFNFQWPEDLSLEYLNRKSTFRTIAKDLGIPIAPGRVCYTQRDVEEAIQEMIGTTGVVIVKQDLAGGGEGNLAVTTETQGKSYMGTSGTYLVTKENSIREISRKVFEALVGGRNKSLVVEAYLQAKEVIYSEVMTSRTTQAELLNWGSMLMEPKWIGFEIPHPRLSRLLASQFERYSLKLASQIGASGYQGRMNCDAIVTTDNEIVFTEFNIRLGGCTHIDILARRLLGSEYIAKYNIVSRNAIHFNGSWESLRQVVGDLAFDRKENVGVIILTEHLSELGGFECMCVAKSSADAHAMLGELMARLGHWGSYLK